MSISFIHKGIDYRFKEGDPVLVHAVRIGAPWERNGQKTVEPFIAEVRELGTAGQYMVVRAQGRDIDVPWDGFTSLKKDETMTTERKTDSMRLPMRGVCTVTADGESLIITLPKNTGADGLERCDRVAKGLMGTVYEFDGFNERFSFYIEVAEGPFIAKQIRGVYSGKSWDRLILKNPYMRQSTHTIDVPGPFVFAVHQSGNRLDLLSARLGRRRMRRPGP